MTLAADFNPNVSVPFSRLRQLFEDSGLQAGVVGATDLKVAQRGAGANMSVDIPAGQAWVEVTTGTRNGLAHIVNDATANVAVAASHATLPRIDQVILQYNDSQIPTGSGDVPTLTVLAGTATSGATLDNRTGAVALGNDRLRLADILIPAASTSVTTANIRDRRPWARGAYNRLVRTSNAAATNDYAVGGAGAQALVDATNLQPRIECSGAPLRVRLLGGVFSTVASNRIDIQIRIDGAQIDGQMDSISPAGTNVVTELACIADFLPVAGSHLIAPYWAAVGSNGQLVARTNQSLFFIVEEIIRPNVSNT